MVDGRPPCPVATPADARTLVVVAFGLTIVVLMACLVPAARAMRVDPITTTHAE